MSRQVDVTVIVPARNEEAFIRDTVPMILGQRYPGRVEFLFVEGRSEDRTRELLEDLTREEADAHILDNPAKKLTSALNLGLRNASGEFVVQMEAHTYYAEDYVLKGVERLRRGDVAWVTGPPIPTGVDGWSRRVALALDSWLGTGSSRKWSSRMEQGASRNGGEVELDTSVFGGVWRRSLLEQIGGWDEEFEVNQDVELAARVLKSGGRIVCLKDLDSRYVPRGSLRGLARQYFAYGYFRVRTSSRHPEALRSSQLLSPALVLGLVACGIGPRRLRRGSKAALLAYAAAVAAASAGAVPRAGPRDAAGLPVVFATMHLSWGVGFLIGCATHGPPVAALARATRLPLLVKLCRRSAS